MRKPDTHTQRGGIAAGAVSMALAASLALSPVSSALAADGADASRYSGNQVDRAVKQQEAAKASAELKSAMDEAEARADEAKAALAAE